MRFSHFCINLAQTIIHRCFVQLSLLLMFAQADYMRKHGLQSRDKQIPQETRSYMG